MAHNHCLQAARHEQGWSIPWTSILLGCSIQVYQSWEYSLTTPSLYWLLCLCARFGRSPEELGYPREQLTYPIQGPWHCTRREPLIQARVEARELVSEVAHIVGVLPRVYLCWELSLLAPRPEQLQALCQHFAVTPREIGFPPLPEPLQAENVRGPRV